MTSTTMPMMETHPSDISVDHQRLGAAIEALIACADSCTACADACLSEEMVADLTTCIRTNMDCADICTTTSRVLTRHTGYNPDIARALLQACVVACTACAEECGSHASMHEHCRICAEACRRCEQACNDLLSEIGA